MIASWIMSRKLKRRGTLEEERCEFGGQLVQYKWENKPRHFRRAPLLRAILVKYHRIATSDYNGLLIMTGAIAQHALTDIFLF